MRPITDIKQPAIKAFEEFFLTQLLVFRGKHFIGQLVKEPTELTGYVKYVNRD